MKWFLILLLFLASCKAPTVPHHIKYNGQYCRVLNTKVKDGVWHYHIRVHRNYTKWIVIK